MIRALDDGSSPLARGLPARIGRGDHARRIIPARAGFTSENNQPYERTQDHPRSRGVYFSFATILMFVAGSSPLARGLHEHRPASRTGLWIIPARAGFTVVIHGAGWGARDHPRSRGVYSDEYLVLTCQPGSSPLARGLRDLALLHCLPERIILARAGFTSAATSAAAPAADHPRSRGVYSPAEFGRIAARGSSPLARGLHGGWLQPGLTQGIIPARAGFTRPSR